MELMWLALGILLGIVLSMAWKAMVRWEGYRWEVDYRAEYYAVMVSVRKGSERLHVGSVHFAVADYDDKLQAALADARDKADTLNAIDRAGV